MFNFDNNRVFRHKRITSVSSISKTADLIDDCKTVFVCSFSSGLWLTIALKNIDKFEFQSKSLTVNRIRNVFRIWKKNEFIVNGIDKYYKRMKINK